MNIIPRPQKLVLKNGQFEVKDELGLQFSDKSGETSFIADYFAAKLKPLKPLKLTVNSPATEKNIIFQTGEFDTGAEGYILEITPENILLKAENPVGIFYGLQSLLQIFFDPSKLNEPLLKINCCQIEDNPRFSWRGMHLDVSRHFFKISFLKKFLDLLALHKMNKFHWHLTDDNGWRIEIKKYPELTRTCAWRKDLEHLPWNERDGSSDPGKGIYGGFYTQDEIREIVDYAAERYIEVIPEIEMPGHSSEVFAAYPEFSCLEKKLSVAPGGYWPNQDIFCAGKDETFRFIQDILLEVIELFPSRYIHIGGDEANKTLWKKCPLCQKRISDLDLADTSELQSWFINQIADFLQDKNKQIIGWDEIMEGDLQGEAVIMCWRGDGTKAAEMAAERNRQMIMCPNSILYFDWKQTETENEKGAFGVTPVSKVYNYDPMPASIATSSPELLMGAQGNVWTEWMPDEGTVEYMTLPRLGAIAETVWTDAELKDFHNFKTRLKNYFEFLSIYNYDCNINVE